jgi:hypothetical protein
MTCCLYCKKLGSQLTTQPKRGSATSPAHLHVPVVPLAPHVRAKGGYRLAPAPSFIGDHRHRARCSLHRGTYPHWSSTNHLLLHRDLFLGSMLRFPPPCLSTRPHLSHRTLPPSSRYTSLNCPLVSDLYGLWYCVRASVPYITSFFPQSGIMDTDGVDKPN